MFVVCGRAIVTMADTYTPIRMLKIEVIAAR